MIAQPATTQQHQVTQRPSFRQVLASEWSWLAVVGQVTLIIVWFLIRNTEFFILPLILLTQSIFMGSVSKPGHRYSIPIALGAKKSDLLWATVLSRVAFPVTLSLVGTCFIGVTFPTWLSASGLLPVAVIMPIIGLFTFAMSTMMIDFARKKTLPVQLAALGLGAWLVFTLGNIYNAGIMPKWLGSNPIGLVEYLACAAGGYVMMITVLTALVQILCRSDALTGSKK